MAAVQKCDLQKLCSVSPSEEIFLQVWSWSSLGNTGTGAMGYNGPVVNHASLYWILSEVLLLILLMIMARFLFEYIIAPIRLGVLRPDHPECKKVSLGVNLVVVCFRITRHHVGSENRRRSGDSRWGPAQLGRSETMGPRGDAPISNSDHAQMHRCYALQCHGQSQQERSDEIVLS